MPCFIIQRMGFYFAWMEFYTLMLLPAMILGLICIIYGIATMGLHVPVNEVCTLKIDMCPICEKYVWINSVQRFAFSPWRSDSGALWGYQTVRLMFCLAGVVRIGNWKTAVVQPKCVFIFLSQDWTLLANKKSLFFFCFFLQATYLIDNPATVCFATFMALWSSVFLILWKRKQTVLSWNFDTYYVTDQEVQYISERRVRLILQQLFYR